MAKCKNRDEINREICGRVEPQIYAFTVKEAKNFTKIGDTYRPLNLRLSEWKNIFGDTLTPIYRHSAIINGKAYFRDISVHKFLEKNHNRLSKEKSEKLRLPYYSKEFFENIVTPQNIDEAINDIAKKYNDGNYLDYDYYDFEKEEKKEKDTFGMREDQKKVVEAFENAIKNNKTRLLLYAVMRFGKSFTAMKCAQSIDKEKGGAKFVLIVSAKKDVINEWQNTVENHIDFKDYVFLAVNDLYNDYEIVNKLIDNKQRIVVCTTLQDLQSKKIKERYKQLFSKKIDLMIIDEAHFGAGTDIQGGIIKKAKLNPNEQRASEAGEEIGVNIEIIKELINEKSLQVKYQLFLSGTPYTILLQKEFSEDEIICSFRYNDIIRKKLQIAEEISKDESKNEWENEYYSFPEMIRFGFNLSDDDINEIKDLKNYYWSSDLSELFKITEDSKKTEKPKFQHEKDVLELLMAIDGSKQYSNILDFLNFEAVKSDRICRHIVICLNQKDMCNALEDLLLSNSDKFINLQTAGKNPKYKIINISGDRKGSKKYKIENIQKTISNFELNNQKTISLTVRRMMTGVTVKEWDTMLMFKSTKSAEEYDQATFRLQSGFTKRVYKKKDDTNNINTKDDYVVENLKPQTIVVDFDLNRMFTIQEKSSGLNGFKSNHKIDDDSIQGKMDNDLQYAPIITMNKGEIQQVEGVDIIKAITNYTKNKSIVDDVSDIKYDELNIDDNNELFELILRQNELTVSSSKFKTKAFMGKNSKIDKEKLKSFLGKLNEKIRNKQTLSKEEKNVRDGLINKKKMLIAKLLFFAFLSPDDIKSCEDITKYIYSNDINIRIASNLELSKNDIILIINSLSEITKEKIKLKIAKANILSSDETIEGVDKNLTALSEFNRFSDSEIVTPKDTCDKMINLIPKNKLVTAILNGKKILDIASKQGEFAYSLYEYLKEYFKNDIDILRNAIYSIPTSKISYEFTRKMYESIGLNVNNIADAENLNSYDLLKLPAEDISNILRQNKKFCTINLKDEIHNKGENMIDFEAVVGNPPYQAKGGSGGNNDAPIYQDFVTLANKLSTQYYSIIAKAAWLATGRKNLLDPFRNFMMNDKSLKNMVVYSDASKVFGKGVEIKGGVAYFVHDNSYNGDCNYILDDKKPVPRNLSDLQDYNVIIRDTILSNIAKKVIRTFDKGTRTVDSIISNDTPFGIPSNPKTSKKTPFKVYSEKTNEHNTLLFYIDKGRKQEWVSRNDIKKNAQDIDKIKVFIPESGGSGNDGTVLGVAEIAPKNSVCSQSYLYASFNSKEEAKNFKKYLETRFLRALVASIKITQSALQDVYKLVPILDFSLNSNIFYDNGRERSVSEIDDVLFNIYDIKDNEIDYIKSIINEIKPKE